MAEREKLLEANIVDVNLKRRKDALLSGAQFADTRDPATPEQAKKEIVGAMYASIKSSGITMFGKQAKVDPKQPSHVVTNKNTFKPQGGG